MVTEEDQGDQPAEEVIAEPPEEEEVTEPADIQLSRLTQAQYLNAIIDLFGEGLALPTSLEPDLEADGLLVTGASLGNLSPRGGELYESAAFSLAAQVVEDEARRRTLISCAVEQVMDDPCLGGFVSSFGRRVWRRPLTEDEQGALLTLATNAATTLEDPWAGVEYVIARLLQSPHFLYRVERGENDPMVPGQRRYTSLEMASRLAFFLWNGIPDDALLDAAEAGKLVEEHTLKDELERMIEDGRFRRAMRNFFVEWLQLHKLDEMRKDPNIFRHYSSDLGAMAREETLRLVEALFVDGDADFREFFTTRLTFVNRRLAAVYNVRAALPSGFGPIELPADGERQGFLGQVSFLGLHSHAVSSSATLRGVFLREALMCSKPPPPPAGVDTSIPEATEDAPTLRERLASHLETPFCASCHTFTDIPGLGFENFDGLGRHRLTENDALIDPSGELDGVPFSDFRELTELVAQSPSVSACLTKRMFDYAMGTVTERGYESTLRVLNRDFEASGRSFRRLMKGVALSKGFRRAGEVE